MYVYSANWLIKEIQEWDAVCLKLHEVLPRAEADRKIKQIQNDCGGLVGEGMLIVLILYLISNAITTAAAAFRHKHNKAQPPSECALCAIVYTV